MSTEDFDTLAPGDQELFAGLHRSVAGATMAAGAADVVALGRRMRNRHRAVAAGIGTSAAALVAAVGVLAPSAGTGAGVVPGVAAQGADTTTMSTRPDPSGAQLLNIQDAGFSLQEHTDGTVTLTVQEVFDPDKLRSALNRAGIPSAIVVQQVPDGWDMTHGIQCAPDPGVHHETPEVNKLLKPVMSGPDLEVVIAKSKIPAGDYLTLTRFESHGRLVSSDFDIYVGRQRTCVPERPSDTPYYPYGK